MIATIDAMDMLQASDELAAMVLQSSVFANYRLSRARFEENHAAQAKVERFKKVKQAHEEVQRFGKYHPDYKSVSAEIRIAKRELDKDEVISAFKQAETELESLLNELSAIIAHSVSSSIKVPTGNPFLTQCLAAAAVAREGAAAAARQI